MTSRAAAPLLALAALAAALCGGGGAGVAAAGVDLFRKGDDGVGGTERAGARLRRDIPGIHRETPKDEKVVALAEVHGVSVDALVEVESLLAEVESDSAPDPLEEEVKSKGVPAKDKNKVKSKNVPDLRQSEFKSMSAPPPYDRPWVRHVMAKTHTEYVNTALMDEEVDEHLLSEEDIPPELPHDDPREKESMQFLLDYFKDPDASPFSCIPIEYVSTMVNATGQNVELLDELRQGCMDGSIVTHEDIVKVQDRVKRLRDTNIDHQVGTVAQEICARLNSTVVGIETSPISEACENLALDPEGVVDAAAALHALRLEAMPYEELQQREMPFEEKEDIEATCRNITMFRKEIDASMLKLAAATEQKHGRSLQEITEVTGHQVSEEILDMYDCLCDNGNPSNRGCTMKVVRVAEHIGESISQQASKDFAAGGKHENMMDMEALKKTLEREARHLTDTDSMTTTTDSQLKTQHQTGVGKCEPNGVQHTPTGGYKICLHAGSVFDCEMSYERADAACVSFECGAGKVIKLRASAKLCPYWWGVILTLELKICIDVISDVLNVIGTWIPAVASRLAAMNIHSGCYRLGTATYWSYFDRLEILVPEHKASIWANVMVSLGGQMWMRFQSPSCNYQDGGKEWMGWYSREYWFKHLPSGDPWTTDDWDTMIWRIMCPVWEWVYRWERGWSNCIIWSRPWVQTSIKFRVSLDWWLWEQTVFEYLNGWKS